MIDYEVFGPYELPQNAKRNRICNDKHSLDAFWEIVNTDKEDLSEAIGCYVFALRAGKGAKPWYVGKSVKQTFKRECLQSHKLVKYNDVLNNQRGTPLIYFLPRMTPKGSFSKPSKAKKSLSDVDFLERLLIGYSLNRNAKILNTKDTIYGLISVPGILNMRKPPSKAAQSLRKVINT